MPPMHLNVPVYMFLTVKRMRAKQVSCVALFYFINITYRYNILTKVGVLSESFEVSEQMIQFVYLYRVQNVFP